MRLLRVICRRYALGSTRRPGSNLSATGPIRRTGLIRPFFHHRIFMIDLRSDTVTKPTPGMLAAIANAEVVDDVIDTDPTMERLHALTAELLGKEAAIFMPSGSMTNQVAVRVHCKPGDEFLCEAGCHIY